MATPPGIPRFGMSPVKLAGGLLVFRRNAHANIIADLIYHSILRSLSCLFPLGNLQEAASLDFEAGVHRELNCIEAAALTGGTGHGVAIEKQTCSRLARLCWSLGSPRCRDQVPRKSDKRCRGTGPIWRWTLVVVGLGGEGEQLPLFDSTQQAEAILASASRLVIMFWSLACPVHVPTAQYRGACVRRCSLDFTRKSLSTAVCQQRLGIKLPW